MFDILSALPIELSVMVIQKLDGKSIFRCRRVSRTWMEIIDSIKKDLRFWTSLCYEEFPHFDDSVYNKISIPCENFYRNLCLWPHVTKASKTSEDIAKFNNNSHEEKVIDIHLYQDNLAVVQECCIKQYNLKTGHLNNKIPLSGNYSKLRENYFGVFILTSGVLIHERKFKFKLGDEYDETISNVVDFCVYNTNVFYTDRNKNVKHYDLVHDLTYEDLAKLPNSEEMLTMECFHGDLYIVTKSGILLKFVKKDFIEVDKFILPIAYHLYGLLRQNIFFCAGFGKLNMYSSGNLATYDLDITAIKMHANILLLATPDWILVFHIKQDSDFLNLDLEMPLLRYPNEEKRKFENIIICVDIFERKYGHEIIVATKSKIYSITLDYTSPIQTASNARSMKKSHDSSVALCNYCK